MMPPYPCCLLPANDRWTGRHGMIACFHPSVWYSRTAATRAVVHDGSRSISWVRGVPVLRWLLLELGLLMPRRHQNPYCTKQQANGPNCNLHSLHRKSPQMSPKCIKMFHLLKGSWDGLIGLWSPLSWDIAGSGNKKSGETRMACNFAASPEFCRAGAKLCGASFRIRFVIIGLYLFFANTLSSMTLWKKTGLQDCDLIATARHVFLSGPCWPHIVEKTTRFLNFLYRWHFKWNLPSLLKYIEIRPNMWRARASTFAGRFRSYAARNAWKTWWCQGTLPGTSTAWTSTCLGIFTCPFPLILLDFAVVQSLSLWLVSHLHHRQITILVRNTFLEGDLAVTIFHRPRKRNSWSSWHEQLSRCLSVLVLVSTIKLVITKPGDEVFDLVVNPTVSQNHPIRATSGRSLCPVGRHQPRFQMFLILSNTSQRSKKSPSYIYIVLVHFGLVWYQYTTRSTSTYFNYVSLKMSQSAAPRVNLEIWKTSESPPIATFSYIFGMLGSLAGGMVIPRSCFSQPQTPVCFWAEKQAVLQHRWHLTSSTVDSLALYWTTPG